ncbi:MAG: beta strand repeat-containing protein, partial [Erythrobacter sp.]
MTGIKAKRARLLIGCGSAALCAVLMLMEHRASAQAFQATPTVAAGTVTIDRNTPGQDLITIGTRTAIIDWVPTEVGPVTLPYLPDGATATFQNGPAVSDFAVLNRILPTNNNAITQFDGAVISRLVNPLTGAATPGGFVAFYSPTGILVGATATFDVGSLMLTTLDPSPASFADFAENGGVMNLLGTQGSTARIQIDPGAQITASAENSFFAVVAADVQMFGNASINGSHAYVAGEIVNLSFSNGLFDIEVPFGTAASGNVLTLDGNIGGPASNGAGDNHVIYGVAAAAGDPISLLLSGNLGFAPAASAFVENGDIILAANFNVSGRQVAQGGWLDFGSDLEFEANNRTSQIEANIALSNATVTSRFLAAGTHSVVAEAALGGTSFARDVVLFGAETAGLRAERGGVLTVGGNANVLAHDYGSIDDMFLDDALGGRAFVSAIGDASVVQIDGLLRVDASAIAALDTGIGAQGNAIGGIVEVQAVDGRIVADGGISLLSYASRRALTTSAEAFLQGGGITVEARGASSAITTAGEISYATWARAANSIGGANGSSAGAGSSFTTAAEGAQIEALDGLSFDSFAIAGNAAGTDAGSAFGGSNVLFVEANSRIDTGGLAGITVDSSASAGRVVSGTQGRGGNAFGGFFDATVAELGTLAVDGSVGIDVSAFAGDGQTGGEASGGFGALRTEGGTINVTGDVFFLFGGFGGDASIGVGGDGGTGTGGGVFIEALETFSTPGSLTIAGFVSVDGLSFGGSGGAGDATTPGGRGGDGIGPPVIPDFGSAGIVVRASAENSQLRLGALDIFAAGFGGQGGDAVAGGQGGAGGTGEGATVFLGTFLPFSLPQSTNGLADLGTTVRVNADGVGGSAGGSGTQAGAAGAGLGGVIALTSSFGTVLAGETTLLAQGFGGQGLDGGFGRGGLVDIGTVFGGDLAFGSLRVNVAGEGDNGTSLG